MANVGHKLFDVDVPQPNKAAQAILMSPNMELLMGIISQEVVLRYRAKVAKDTGQLMRSAEAQTVVGGHRHDRWVGKVTIGGEKAVAYWYSPRNPNPGNLFYYGVLHEHGDGGNPPSGWDFPAHKDLRHVVDTMGFHKGG